MNKSKWPTASGCRIAAPRRRAVLSGRLLRPSGRTVAAGQGHPKLGGYDNRAKDQSAVPQVLWTAIRRMGDFALAWQAFVHSIGGGV